MGINTMSDQRFVWVIQHFANPQGGTDMYDKIPHYRYGFVWKIEADIENHTMLCKFTYKDM